MALIEYGPPITLAAAKAVSEAAEAEARAQGWSMVIAVVDSTGHLVVLHKMDHAQYGSVEIAQHKAQTAVDFKRPSKVFEDGIVAGGIGLRMLWPRNLCPMEGGVPIVDDGKIIGAIGISGAQSTQDGRVAQAALENREV